MLRLVKWLNYRDRVLEYLGALFVAYPRGRQFARDFPGLRGRIRADFAADVPPPRAAVGLAAAMIEELVGQLDDKGRRSVREALAGLPPCEVERLAADNLARASGRRGDAAQTMAEVIAVALFMAGRMSVAGTVGDSERAAFAAAIDAVLADGGHGLSHTKEKAGP